MRVGIVCLYTVFALARSAPFSLAQAEVWLPQWKPHPPLLHILRPGVSRVLFSFFGGGEPLEVSTGVNRRTPRAHCCRFYTIRLPAGRVSQNLYSKFLSLHLDYLKVRGSARSKEFSFVFIFVLLGV